MGKEQVDQALWLKNTNALTLISDILTKAEQLRRKTPWYGKLAFNTGGRWPSKWRQTYVHYACYVTYLKALQRYMNIANRIWWNELRNGSYVWRRTLPGHWDDRHDLPRWVKKVAYTSGGAVIASEVNRRRGSYFGYLQAKKDAANAASGLTSLSKHDMLWLGAATMGAFVSSSLFNWPMLGFMTFALITMYGMRDKIVNFFR